MIIDKNSGWPQWPQYSDKTKEAVINVFDSNRWAISGYWTGEVCSEQKFAKKYADYNNVKYCVPTINGSSSVLIALEAIGVGFGDEVIMPALTWIATATAILKVNAKPILVDVESDTYCMDTSKIEEAITEKTKAIIVVHLMGCMVNMDEILRISKKYNIPIIEDCAQSHGMSWRGKKAGSIGDIGAFSFQQGKILTSGEGGAVITNNEEYFKKLEQLRSDSRKFISNENLGFGDMELDTNGTMQGYNYCLSEFQAAILIDQMDKMQEFNDIKISNASYLVKEIEKIDGFINMKKYNQIDYQTFYGFVIKIDRSYFNGISVMDICNRIKQHLCIGSFYIHPIYKPVHKNELFCPWTSNKYCKDVVGDEKYWRNLNFPIAESANNEAIVFHHSMLLADKDRLDDLITCLKQISALAKK